MLEKDKQEKSKKCPEKSCFGVCGRQWILSKMVLFLEKNCKHFVFSVRQHYLFWENCPIFVSVQTPKTLQKEAFQQAQGETFFGILKKGVLEGASKDF